MLQARRFRAAAASFVGERVIPVGEHRAFDAEAKRGGSSRRAQILHSASGRFVLEIIGGVILEGTANGGAERAVGGREGRTAIGQSRLRTFG